MKINRKLLWSCGAIVLCTAAPIQAQTTLPTYLDNSVPIDLRVEDALKRMTLQEKIDIIHAQSKFSSRGVPRLGIPELWTSDGPHGIRPEVLWDEWNQAGWTNDSCMAFPALTCLAATWNPSMALLYGKSIGEEARYRKKDVLLGPGVNIYRTPLNGRNFEYMGEDPYLTSRMVVPYIKGVQQNGVAACVKHFALNNQEHKRTSVSVEVDDRALYEIYLPAFKAAVQEGGAWSVMGAYNKYKGQYTTHHSRLINEILRKEWGFAGALISDWGSTHNTLEAIRNGLDLEFGTWTDGLATGTKNAYDNYFMAKPYLDLIQCGKVGTKELDEKVKRVLKLIFRTAMNPNRPYGSFGSPEHGAAGKQIAEEGIVLLQNKKNILPIDLNRVKRIAVIGENAIKMMTVGGGSSSLKAKYEITPLNGIKEYVGTKAEVVYARGYVGDPKSEYNGVKVQNLEEKRPTQELQKEATELARTADCVIFIGGLNKSPHQDSEGDDRTELGLPYGQDQLIEALIKVNPNLIMVNISGNAVAMPWVNRVPAILQAWFMGSEAGHALADVLFGQTCPSGKLPFTFPARLEDNSAHALGEYPGDKSVKYNESIFVGYRWTDKEKITPLFPFGHGLSYTTFKYGKATLDKQAMQASDTLWITIPITNTGRRSGAEVIQLYIRDKESSLPRPMKELKGFAKVQLAPGETKTVTLAIGKDALSFFDDTRHEWVAEPGKFEAIVAASATDIKGVLPFELKE